MPAILSKFEKFTILENFSWRQSAHSVVYELGRITLSQTNKEFSLFAKGEHPMSPYYKDPSDGKCWLENVKCV